MKFRTSGLRGLSVDLKGRASALYATAFGRYLLNSGVARPGDAILIGRDFRDSSPEIAANCADGVLTASDFEINGHRLQALPTRDCFVPILATLALAASRRQPLSAIASSHHLAFAAADRLENFPVETSARLMAHLRADPANLAAFLQPVGEVASISDLDGLRVTLKSGRIIHLRPSGNAPEMRCYVEAEDEAAAVALLQAGLARIRWWANAN